MMERLIANLAITAALFACQLANYWYTFGLWPRSWLAFFGFGALVIVLQATSYVMNNKNKP
jgi:hypothetical protein